MVFQAVENRLIALLHNRPRTFAELLKETWGIYPERLADALRQLERKGLVEFHPNGTWKQIRNVGYHLAVQNSPTATTQPIDIDKSLSAAINDYKTLVDGMPEPHPHDFDWRFSPIGLRNIAEKVFAHHDPTDRVCVIAAPTVFVYLTLTGYFEHITLYERSHVTINWIRGAFPGIAGVYQHDLQHPWPLDLLPQREVLFDCVIADPPWYQDYYELFLSRAKEMVRNGAIIHLALFPLFAKRAALRERTAIFSYAQNNGIDLIELSQGILRYETPLFEKTALKQVNYEQESSLWRIGDLATFFVSNKTGKDVAVNIEEGSWIEFVFDKSKIKLRHREPIPPYYEQPSIIQLLPNSPFLPSVSRKYNDRDKIDLWTSRNQAFVVEGSHVVQIMLELLILNGLLVQIDENEIFRKISKHFSIDSTTVARDCAPVLETIREILDRETQEGKNGR